MTEHQSAYTTAPAPDPTERRSVLILEPAVYRQLAATAKRLGMSPAELVEHFVGRAES